ncbi:hypothetical protein [Pseudoalteromonas piscicida]|uniref:hypothetical protein n=1 Tax=Pseudoalteromonas piscicida TaxID=43662 RepID=UPI001430D281|nr:hypothetical protein [Pseudoalteromonas piscicida]
MIITSVFILYGNMVERQANFTRRYAESYGIAISQRVADLKLVLQADEKAQ